MINVNLYSRVDCHLCELAQQYLRELQAEIPHNLTVINVDSNPDLQRAYGFEVPVVEIGPYKIKAPFSQQDLRITLFAAQDRKEQFEELGGQRYQTNKAREQTWSTADRITYWLGRHYLGLFNLLVLFYVGLPALAPVLLRIGIESPANVIYKIYGGVCHQLAYRSFFVFGEQSVYPREAAGIRDLLTYNQATRLSEESTANAQLAARNFVGNEHVGYKIALCQRDVSIYAAILIFGLLYALTSRRIPALPWYIWVLVGLAPIALDGTSQLLSQPPFSLYTFRESTPLLRIVTGGLFGFTTAWFGYPMVEQTMAETRQILAAKLLRLRQVASVENPIK
ncbi:MAG: DUF2085 domain-containing protein [Anaerolineales bacterium]|nr:MAG: DUF2085 domain-containing protein [Anaerolineales bacterium]